MSSHHSLHLQFIAYALIFIDYVLSNTPPIVVQGNKMYNSVTGERFLIKGITYEYAMDDDYYTKYGESVIDNVLKNLQGQYNTIRLYNINPDLSYAKVMKRLSQLGLYVMPAASPGNEEYFGPYRYSTMRKDLGPSGSNTCYPASLLQYGKKVIANFAQYDNTLAVITCNEIMQMDLTAAACVKQYIADLKLWMRSNWKKIRLIPLAYAGADSAHVASKTDADSYNAFKIQGLTCGDKQMLSVSTQSVDIYLLNTYRWLPGHTFAMAFQPLVNWARGAPIVVALGEFGAKVSLSQPRDWGMVPYMLGTNTANNQFDQIFSGGLAYTYGFAGLSQSNLFPFILGGGSQITSFPGSNITVDYTNLVKAFKNNDPPKQMASWNNAKDKCIWVPPVVTDVSSTVSPSNVLKYGWNVTDCSVLKLPGDSGSWFATSREGVVCTDGGDTCDVPLPSYSTTQDNLCGFSLTVSSGGATCKADTDCGSSGGRCIASVCVCLSCYTGPICSVLDKSCASAIDNHHNAAKYIFPIVGSLIVIVLIFFVALYVQWKSHLRGVAKIENRLRRNSLPDARTSV